VFGFCTFYSLYYSLVVILYSLVVIHNFFEKVCWKIINVWRWKSNLFILSCLHFQLKKIASICCNKRCITACCCDILADICTSLQLLLILVISLSIKCSHFTAEKQELWSCQIADFAYWVGIINSYSYSTFCEYLLLFFISCSSNWGGKSVSLFRSLWVLVYSTK